MTVEMTLEEMAFQILLAHVQTGQDSLGYLVNERYRAEIQIKSSFELAKEFKKVSEKVCAVK